MATGDSSGEDPQPPKNKKKHVGGKIHPPNLGCKSSKSTCFTISFNAYSLVRGRKKRSLSKGSFHNL